MPGIGTNQVQDSDKLNCEAIDVRNFAVLTWCSDAVPSRVSVPMENPCVQAGLFPPLDLVTQPITCSCPHPALLYLPKIHSFSLYPFFHSNLCPQPPSPYSFLQVLPWSSGPVTLTLTSPISHLFRAKVLIKELEKQLGAKLLVTQTNEDATTQLLRHGENSGSCLREALHFQLSVVCAFRINSSLLGPFEMGLFLDTQCAFSKAIHILPNNNSFRGSSVPLGLTGVHFLWQWELMVLFTDIIQAKGKSSSVFVMYHLYSLRQANEASVFIFGESGNILAFLSVWLCDHLNYSFIQSFICSVTIY